MRSRVLDFRLGRGPESLGQCRNNLPVLCGLINEATTSLLEVASESGWWGTWQKIIFQVDPGVPYLTLPRGVSRLINFGICNTAYPIQNQFYNWQEFSAGSIGPSSCSGRCDLRESIDDGSYPTMRDLDSDSDPMILRLYPTDQRDVGKRVLIQGVDANGTTLRSLDNGIDVQGIYVTLQTPFVDTDFTMGGNSLSKLTGIQKDITVSDVRLFQVNTATAEQTALSVFEPSEQVPWYRRYRLAGLPGNCCPGATTVQVSAIAKLDFIPVSVDQDYLLISNLPALKAACESIRYSEMDSPQAQQMAASKWKQAIRRLNNELASHVGRNTITVNFAPFGNDRMRLEML